MQWQYEPRDPEAGWPPKHRWHENRAGFRYDPSGKIEGCCPAGMTPEKAAELLNSGLEDSPRGWARVHPKSIYNFHDGVVYKAVETNPGKSYHGFPCKGPKSDGGRHMTARMMQRILKLAEERGQRKAIEDWFNEHP